MDKIDKIKLFVIWLDGYLDACGNQLNEKQTTIVKTKLNSLFVHEAESMNETENVIVGIKHILPSNYDLPDDLNGPTIFRC